MSQAYWTSRKLASKLLLAGFLLTSCSQTDPNINIIGSHYNNANYKNYLVTESIKSCFITKWQEEIVFESSAVTRTVKTKCNQVYKVEFITKTDQFSDQYVYEYQLLDHKINILTTGNDILLKDGVRKSTTDFFRELNKK